VSSLSLPAWLNPIEILERLLASRREAQVKEIDPHLALWFGVGACCLCLAAGQLRPAYHRQLAWRPGRWLWAFRTQIGNDPIRWREQYVIGLTPFPWLRMIPRWLAMVGVLCFSGTLAATSLDSIYGGHALTTSLETGDLSFALNALQRPVNEERVQMEVSLMGGILLVIGGTVVGIRCLGSIVEEKRRKTWDELRLMPLSLEDILRGKWLGVLLATIPYLFMYILPMFAIATLNGWAGIGIATIWLCLACLVMLGAAFFGTELSATEEQSRAIHGPRNRFSMKEHQPRTRERPVEKKTAAGDCDSIKRRID
jgi:hypothetical protein